MQVRVRDLDVVPEDLVESDLERADTGTTSFQRFELCDPLPRGARAFVDRVEVGVIAAPNRAAFSNAEWWVFDEGIQQSAGQLRRGADVRGKLPRDQR